MRNRILATLGIAAATVALTATAANASVTFDPTPGTGFVGKGDIQTAFVWNDATLQANAKDVSFTYSSTSDDTYAVTCEWDTGNKVIIHHVQNKSGAISDSVAYDIKPGQRLNPNSKVTGFNLLGKGNVTESSTGTIPVVGGACPSTGNEDGTDSSVDKKITNVEFLSSVSTEDLSATFGGVSHSIWPPAPAA